MNVEMGPIWKQIRHKTYPPLKESIECDVAIVGGGISGMTAAYFLSKAGKKVVVINKKEIINGATSHTTAFLTYSIDTDMPSLIKIFGKRIAQNVYESGREAIDTIERIVKEEKIE